MKTNPASPAKALIILACVPICVIHKALTCLPVNFCFPSKGYA